MVLYWLFLTFASLFGQRALRAGASGVSAAAAAMCGPDAAWMEFTPPQVSEWGVTSEYGMSVAYESA